MPIFLTLCDAIFPYSNAFSLAVSATFVAVEENRLQPCEGLQSVS